MKELKFIAIFIWLALTSVCIVSCGGSDDEPSTDPENPTNGESVNDKRISKIYFSDSHYGAGAFNFEWNDEGKLSRYYVNIYQGNRIIIDHIFKYSDNKVIVTGKGVDENETYTYVLNKNGLAQYCEFIEHGNNVYVNRYDFTYNKSGYLTKIEEDNHINEFIYSNKDIIRTCFAEDTGNGYWGYQYKTCTNSVYENKSGIHHPIFEEDCYRHIGAFYAGILGKSCGKLVKSITDEDYSEYKVEYTYEFDEDGYLISEKIIDNEGYIKTKRYSYE